MWAMQSTGVAPIAIEARHGVPSHCQDLQAQLGLLDRTVGQGCGERVYASFYGAARSCHD